MINLQIEILEIFPSINELVENEDDNIILIMIIKGIQNVFNLSDIIIEQIPITLKIKEIKTIINIEIYRNENIIAEGDFLPFNDVMEEVNNGFDYDLDETSSEDLAANLVNSISVEIKTMISHAEEYGLTEGEIKTGIAICELLEN